MSDFVQNVGASSSATYAPALRAGGRRLEVSAPAAAQVGARDSVEFTSRPAETSAQKVARVRQGLTEGTFLNPDKLDIAIERLAKDLGL